MFYEDIIAKYSEKLKEAQEAFRKDKDAILQLAPSIWMQGGKPSSPANGPSNSPPPALPVPSMGSSGASTPAIPAYNPLTMAVGGAVSAAENYIKAQNDNTKRVMTGVRADIQNDLERKQGVVNQPEDPRVAADIKYAKEETAKLGRVISESVEPTKVVKYYRGYDDDFNIGKDLSKNLQPNTEGIKFYSSSKKLAKEFGNKIESVSVPDDELIDLTSDEGTNILLEKGKALLDPKRYKQLVKIVRQNEWPSIWPDYSLVEEPVVLDVLRNTGYKGYKFQNVIEGAGVKNIAIFEKGAVKAAKPIPFRDISGDIRDISGKISRVKEENLPQIIDGKVRLYHVTNKKNALSILKNGFKSTGEDLGGGGGYGTFFHTKPEYSHDELLYMLKDGVKPEDLPVAWGKLEKSLEKSSPNNMNLMTVLQVDVPKEFISKNLSFDPEQISPGDVFTKMNIPAKYIKFFGVK